MKDLKEFLVENSGSKYNYLEHVTQDVLDYIKSYIDINDYREVDREGDIILLRSSLKDYLYDELFNEDSVTGNASGSYTFSTYEAEQNLVGNQDLIEDVEAEFGELNKDNPEKVDVSIRCYVLGEAINDALEEVEDNLDEYIKK